MRQIEYSQPEQYRFSQTTLLAAKAVSQILNENMHLPEIKLLDLFAGSGFFSLEAVLQSTLKNKVHLTVLELQQVFQQHLVQNTKRATDVYPNLQVMTQIADAIGWLDTQSSQWDYILLNPPHYFEREVIQPADPIRAKCHTIARDDWEKVLAKLWPIFSPQTCLLMHLNRMSVLYEVTLAHLKTNTVQIIPLLKNEVLLIVRRVKV